VRELCDLVAQTLAERKKTLSFLLFLVPAYQTGRASERRAFNANGASRQSLAAFLLTRDERALSRPRQINFASWPLSSATPSLYYIRERVPKVQRPCRIRKKMLRWRF
jgi:hypothetical protein